MKKTNRTNVWSFATAKLQAKIIISLLILVLAVIGFSMAACEEDKSSGGFPGTGGSDGGGGTGGSGGGSGGTGGGGEGSTMTWTAVTDSKFGTSDIRDIAFGNGKFVAVGDDSKMAYSSDGVTWTAVSNTTFNASISAIAFGKDTFVAGDSYSGKMATSANGTTWTAVSNSKFTNSIFTIAYGNSQFVAGGRYGEMATSSNGTTWTTVKDSKLGTYINDIAYGNNIWVAVGTASDFSGKTTYSTDNGVTWTLSNNKNTTTIAFGNGKFVAGDGDDFASGLMSYSANGKDWTKVEDPKLGGNIYAIAYGDNMFVAGCYGNGSIAYSADGVTWTKAGETKLGRVFAIAYGNGTWVAVGPNGKISYSTGN